MVLSVSLAFMLPVSSPNNAVIFSSGKIKVKDMVCIRGYYKLPNILFVSSLVFCYYF